MPNSLPIFITIAPLLFFGIWLIAEESFIGTSFAERQLRGRKLENLLTLILLSLFVLFGLLLSLWDRARQPILLMIAVALLFSAQFLRKRERGLRSWQQQIDLELPGFIQMLALMISSGTPPIRSIELIAQRADSKLARELRSVVRDVTNGTPSNQAIDALVQRIDSPGIRKFGNSIVIAIERGSPLVPVLLSLARDFRVDSKNELLRRAGKAEIALMIPVVFLLLPLSVLFALFPSITQLQGF